MLSLSNKYFEVFSFLNLVAVDFRAATDPAKRNSDVASSVANTKLMAAGISATTQRKIQDLAR